MMLSAAAGLTAAETKECAEKRVKHPLSDFKQVYERGHEEGDCPAGGRTPFIQILQLLEVCRYVSCCLAVAC